MDVFHISSFLYFYFYCNPKHLNTYLCCAGILLNDGLLLIIIASRPPEKYLGLYSGLLLFPNLM